MPPDYSELSSLAASLETLTQRVSLIAEAADHEGNDSAAAELFAVERALEGAQRRLARMLQRSG